MYTNLKPSAALSVRHESVRAGGHRVPLLVLSVRGQTPCNAPGVLWLHGGGYFLGLKEMVYMSRAVDLMTKFGAVVVAPGYRLAFQAPYPAALDDCSAALAWLADHAEELGVNPHQLMLGGESAGGGLCAALAMKTRDEGKIQICYQMPLYPMIDDRDTETSRCNHAKIWNTRRNHLGWAMYLRGCDRKILSPYAAPARQMDYHGLPPCYTFVGTAEPFYAETLEYVRRLKAAGVEAEADVYPGMFHAFDMLYPDLPESKTAVQAFNDHFEYALSHYFA